MDKVSIFTFQLACQEILSSTLTLILFQWYPEVLHFCPTTPLILVGLKSDLRTKRTCIDLLKTQGLTPSHPRAGTECRKANGRRVRRVLQQRDEWCT